MTQTTYPGVYIEEFAPGAPIEGVGTSTAAFIGVAEKGDLDTPTKIGSWDQFQKKFGSRPVPGFYLWYAVRAFYENGGLVCHVVRASNGAYAERTFKDSSNPAQDLIRMRARQPGDPATPVNVEITRNPLLAGGDTRLYRPAGSTRTAVSAGDRKVLLKANQGKRFRPGDRITIEGGAEILTVDGVSGEELSTVEAAMSDYAANKDVTLASPLAGERTLRIEHDFLVPPGALSAGTVLTFDQGGNTDTQVVDSVRAEVIDANLTTYRVTLRRGLRVAFDFDGADVEVNSEEFDVVVSQGVPVATYAGLSSDAAHPRYVLRVMNDDATGLVQAEWADPLPSSDLPESLPKDAAGNLAGGAEEDLAALGDVDFKDALDTLRRVDDVNFIAVPDRRTKGVHDAMISHCERLGDRFAVLDARSSAQVPFGTDSDDAIEAQRREVDSTRGYAGLYYPWVKVSPAGTGEPLAVPPSGHVCGIIAKTDNSRGVHKAPANVVLAGAQGLSQRLSDVEHGQLNIVGINCIRVFADGQRPTLWGARTTATDTNWRYVNIRRLFLYLEESIQDGINWAVFEPNNPALWKKLKRSISDFLRRSWREGALFGEKPEDAYYVRIDEDLNPFSEQALGRLYIEIGVRPSYPAEFIIVRIGIWPGGSEVSES